MPDAELELECIAAEVRCRACGGQSEIASAWSIWCSECDSPDVEVLRGNEFLVTSLDVSSELVRVTSPKLEVMQIIRKMAPRK